MARIPHLRIPLVIGADGNATTLEQDDPDEVLQCVRVLFVTEEGSRPELPYYGIPSLVFDANIPRDVLASKVLQWESRATAIIQDTPALLDEMVREVSVAVSPASGR